MNKISKMNICIPIDFDDERFKAAGSLDTVVALGFGCTVSTDVHIELGVIPLGVYHTWVVGKLEGAQPQGIHLKQSMTHSGD